MMSQVYLVVLDGLDLKQVCPCQHQIVLEVQLFCIHENFATQIRSSQKFADVVPGGKKVLYFVYSRQNLPFWFRSTIVYSVNHQRCGPYSITYTEILIEYTLDL